ncbi:MAG: methyl-accepting chemotaxis protein [Synergistaceae bacterium]|jgi:methyl-accepting chemotaxis protein|nr:methyl-accepting chemotaxis protein [Synergistaceae bacterium]
MSWLKNRSIGAKLGILVGIPLVILIVLTVLSHSNSLRMSDGFTDSYNKYTKPTIDLAVARANLQGTQKNILKILITTDPKRHEEFVGDLRARRTENINIFDGLKRILTAEELDQLNKIEILANEMRRLQDECIDLDGKGKDQEGIERFFSELEIKALDCNTALRDLSNQMIGKTDSYQNQLIEASKAEFRNSGIMALIGVIITIVLSSLISGYITKPVNEMKGKVIRFASGDISISFLDAGHDAISQMGNELDKMVTALRVVVKSIQGASGHISDASEDFSAMAQQTNASVEEFRANVDEMSANLSGLAASSEEVNASVEEVAAGAQTTAERGTDIARKVDEAMKAGDTGMNAVHSVVGGISRVADSSTLASSAILELGSRARQIQSFVSQIGSIADQTNLLALNAAIEAARAGDAGRGFAVVAEEVRKLAEDSNIAAKNIAELASTITSELDTIVRYAQENASDSSKAKELSSETENAISLMISSLRGIATSTQDLAAIAQEQAASSEEIAEAVQGMSKKINDTANASENIRTSVAEVATASEKVAEGAENLSNLSGDLRSELEFFRLTEDDGRQQGKGRANLRALPSSAGR